MQEMLQEDEEGDQKAEALKQKADFESLTSNSGWCRLIRWMKAQEQARLDQIVLVPSTGVKSQLEAEFAKGEITMMRTIVEMVNVGLETATAVVRSLNEHERNISTSDSESADDGDSGDDD